MKNKNIIFSGIVDMEVEGWITKRSDIPCHLCYLHAAYKWKGSVSVNGTVDWQWHTTKKEAVAWVKQNIPSGTRK